MGILLCILLFILGAMAAESFINAKAPACNKFLSAISPYQGVIGMAGIVFGIIMVLFYLNVLRYAGIVPLSLLTTLASVLMLGLGFIFGLDYIRKNLNDPNAPILLKFESWRLQLLPYKEKMGIAAMVVAVISLLLFL